MIGFGQPPVEAVPPEKSRLKNALLGFSRTPQDNSVEFHDRVCFSVVENEQSKPTEFPMNNVVRWFSLVMVLRRSI